GEHDRYARGCGLRRLGGRRPETSDDHVRIGFDQVGRQLGQALQVPFGGTEVEDQVLAFGIAQVSKPVPYNHRILIAGQGKISHPVGFLCLLRARREWPNRSAAEKRYEVAPPHSITSSASESRLSEMLTPSAFAVFRLITNSNLVTCCTGK